MDQINLSDYVIDPNDYKDFIYIKCGGNCMVYKATDKRTDEFVIFKIITTPGFQSTTKLQQLFLREVITPLSLDTEGIVHLLGFHFPFTEIEQNELKQEPNDHIKDNSVIDVNNRPDLSKAFIVSEYMVNGDLNNITSAYLKRCSIPGYGPTQRSKNIFGISYTMATMHDKKIIHRDLKSENIYLNESFDIKIADFGLSKVLNDDMTHFIDTPFYMAPEIYSGDCSSVEPSVDVYSFGMILYKMFEDEMKLDDNLQYRDINNYLNRISKGIRPVKTDKIPEVYWELIQACWSPSPKNRPTFWEIVEILLDDIFALNENGFKTDLDELHEYQNRMKIIHSEKGKKVEINKNVSCVRVMSQNNGMTNPNITTQLEIKPIRKCVFNWKRH